MYHMLVILTDNNNVTLDIQMTKLFRTSLKLHYYDTEKLLEHWQDQIASWNVSWNDLEGC